MPYYNKYVQCLCRYGLKLVMACDADTHYMCNAIPYLGKGSLEVPRLQTLGEVFALELTRDYGRRGRTVTTDNWFTSLPLANSLRRTGLELVGTIRQKPYLPKELLSFQMAVGESVAAFNYEDKVTVQCHQGSKQKKVLLLSTVHHKPSVVERRKTDIQMFYNATKGGVDSFDQMCAALSCSRKTRRWPLCMFYGVINLCMVNSYIVYCAKNPHLKLSRRDFHGKVAEALSRPWAMHRLSEQHYLMRELRSLIGTTFEVVVDTPSSDPQSSKTDRRQRCYMCPSKSNTKTRVLCSTCQKCVCPQHEVRTCLNCHT